MLPCLYLCFRAGAGPEVCFPGSYANHLTSAWVSPMGYTAERLESGEKGKARMFPFSMYAFLADCGLISSMTPAHHNSSFSQLTLALGHLALFFQFIDGSNVLPRLTCGVPPGHPCSFSLFLSSV